MPHPTTGLTDPTPRSIVLSAIWRARWVVLAAALVAGAGGYLVSDSRPSTYQSSSQVVIAAGQAFDPLGGQSFGDASRFISDQVAVMTTESVLDLAIDRLGTSESAGELYQALDVKANGDNNVIDVTASAPDAQTAADRANAVVAGYRAFVAAQVQTEANAALGATTDPTVADQVRTQAAIYGDGVGAVQRAVPSAEPSSPKPVRDAVLLAVVAALVVIGLALWRRAPAADPRRGLDEGGHRLLGTVPVRPARTRSGQSPDPQESALVLVALDYARAGAPGPVLLTGAGAAGVVHGLAASAALQGRRVTVVDADPSQADLRQRAGGRFPERPLSDLGRAPEQDVLVGVPVPAGATGEVWLARVGTADAAAWEPERVHAALEELAASSDLVLIQAGPVTTSPLAYALVGESGGVVATIGPKDDPTALEALEERVASAGRPILGVVVAQPVRHGKDQPGAAPQQPTAAARPAAQPVTAPAPEPSGPEAGPRAGFGDSRGPSGATAASADTPIAPRG